MRFIISVSVLFILLISCYTKNNIPININGDWVGKKDSSDFADRQPIFSFEDSIGKLVHPWAPIIKYRIIDDQLMVYELSNSAPAKLSGSFTIIKQTDDSLILYQNNYKDTIKKISRLAKVKPKNNMQLSRIYFVSSGCFGRCPSMFLEIDSFGKLLFYGRSFTNPQEIFSVRLTTAKYGALLKKIQNLQLDSLHKKYEAHWSDDQTCGINIITGDRNYFTTVYGFDKEPIELRILLNYLMELYQRVDLQKDSIIKPQYFLQDKEFKQLIMEVSPPAEIARPYSQSVQ